MNIILMAAMMAVALLFMHGRGHHEPGPAPGHHATQKDEPPVPSREREAVHPAGPARRESTPTPDRSSDLSALPPRAD